MEAGELGGQLSPTTPEPLLPPVNGLSGGSHTQGGPGYTQQVPSDSQDLRVQLGLKQSLT